MATVHNLSKERMRDGDVYIGRAGQGHDGYFGNPWQIGQYVAGMGNISRRQAIELYEADTLARIAADPEFRERVKSLHGKRLFCFCAPQPCHGDVLAAYADALNLTEQPS